MKFTRSKDITIPKVYYFYMPANEEKPAEVIEVLHGNSLFIQVPMRDEDKQLMSFYQRTITAKELAKFGKRQTWQIFTSWQELEEDHAKLNVPVEVLQELYNFKSNCSLPESIAAFDIA